MRLNAEIRSRLVKAMADEAFGERRKKLKKRAQQLDDLVYSKVMPKKYRDLVETLDACFWTRTKYMYTRGADGQQRYHDFSEEKRIPAGWGASKTHMLDDRKFCEDMQKTQDDLRSLDEERRAFRNEAAAVLSDIRSLKQLEEAWPEAVPFLPKSEQRALVADVSNLNKILGVAA
jgi:hypothetical protein